MQYILIKLTIIVISLFLANSCSKPKEIIPTAESSYTDAMRSLKRKDYIESAKLFEKIEDDFPFSKWAVKAQTMAVYAHYKEKEYLEVIRIVDEFAKTNPANKALPYMLYIKAICYYDQITDISRAQDMAKQASATFRELIARFSTSEYSSDAKDRLSFIDEHIAGAKMSVGRYQIMQKNYVGAIANFQDVITRYGYTNQAPEGYYRLYEIYAKLGVNNLTDSAMNTLKSRFPDNIWAEK
jgi:outer membrane protein assembly factor BamD